MSATREPIYSALFNLVVNDARAQANFVTTGRFLRQIDDVATQEMPALFMFQRPETRQQMGKGIPAKRTLHCIFVVYCSTSDPQSVLPATLLNTAADILDDVITQPGNPQNVQTLGGLVEHVYIEPSIDNFEALLQDKSVLVAAVAMLIP